MGAMKKKYMPHQVIENKLLTALEDGPCVGILASKSDCEMLIEALGRLGTADAGKYADGIKELCVAAFGKETL